MPGGAFRGNEPIREWRGGCVGHQGVTTAVTSQPHHRRDSSNLTACRPGRERRFESCRGRPGGHRFSLMWWGTCRRGGPNCAGRDNAYRRCVVKIRGASLVGCGLIEPRFIEDEAVRRHRLSQTSESETQTISAILVGRFATSVRVVCNIVAEGQIAPLPHNPQQRADRSLRPGARTLRSRHSVLVQVARRGPQPAPHAVEHLTEPQ
jgi:hypothetical protein